MYCTSRDELNYGFMHVYDTIRADCNVEILYTLWIYHFDVQYNWVTYHDFVYSTIRYVSSLSNKFL